MENRIDPDSWTIEELVKHTYREVRNLLKDREAERADTSISDKLSSLESAINELAKEYQSLATEYRTRLDEDKIAREKSAMLIKVGGLAFTVINSIIAIVTFAGAFMS